MSDIRGLLHGQVERSQDRLLELYGEMTPRAWDALLDRVEQQLDDEESAQAGGTEKDDGGNGAGDGDDRTGVAGPGRGARGALRTGPGLGLVALVVAAVAAAVPPGPAVIRTTVFMVYGALAALLACGHLWGTRPGARALAGRPGEPVVRFPAQPPPEAARFA
ncbi:hypothetical protein [Streptomyces xinghaiensis]|uniref:hypothetical protein n=1 Tax=Streptomyces xinghaiensis TaxID=1038928 RepID=UPI002E0E3576|nr:hypothetical protein OG463_06605 [Streptomyces xinghaiensis]